MLKNKWFWIVVVILLVAFAPGLLLKILEAGGELGGKILDGLKTIGDGL